MCVVLALTRTMCAPYVDILTVNIIQKLLKKRVFLSFSSLVTRIRFLRRVRNVINNTPVTRLFRLSHPAVFFSCFVSVSDQEFERHSIALFGRHQLQLYSCTTKWYFCRFIVSCIRQVCSNLHNQFCVCFRCALQF